MEEAFSFLFGLFSILELKMFNLFEAMHHSVKSILQ
jgi:hypothetical protein